MSIVVYGTGNLGLTMALHLISCGHSVACVGAHAETIMKIHNSSDGVHAQSDFMQAIHQKITDGLLMLTGYGADVVPFARVVVIAEDILMMQPTYHANVREVERIAAEISVLAESYMVVSIRNFLPVGSIARIQKVISNGALYADIDVALHVDLANYDFFTSLLKSQFVIGVDADRAYDVLHDVYACNGIQPRFMSISDAELVQHASGVCCFRNEVYMTFGGGGYEMCMTRG